MGTFFDKDEQHFVTQAPERLPDLPLSVTLQINRDCNLQCIYCSEIIQIARPSIDNLVRMMNNLSGVQRIIISGGEPTLRKDLPNILEEARKRFPIVAMASNATLITPSLAQRIAPFVDYVDVTIDGPRSIHERIRGEFDKVARGIFALVNAGIEVSIVTVLLKQNLRSIPFISQMADMIGARKHKILSPIPKGRGVQVIDERVTKEDIESLASLLQMYKRDFGWKVRITIVDWEQVGEGHALLVHPDGEVVASPVWSYPGCIRKIGNLYAEDIKNIWQRYPYKENHLRKYTEQTLIVLS